jgi:flagellar hook-length control protein FliK
MNPIDIIMASNARESRPSRERECVLREDAPNSQRQPAVKREGNGKTHQSAFKNDGFAAQLEAYTKTETQEQLQESARNGLPAVQIETDTADPVPVMDEAHIDWKSIAFLAYTGHLATDAGEAAVTLDESQTTTIPTTDTLLAQETSVPPLPTPVPDAALPNLQPTIPVVNPALQQPHETSIKPKQTEPDQTVNTDQTDQTDPSDEATITPFETPIMAAASTPAFLSPASVTATVVGEKESKADTRTPSAPPPVSMNTPHIRTELVAAALPTDMENGKQGDAQDQGQQSSEKHAALRPQPGIPEGDATHSLTAAESTVQPESTVRVFPSPPPTPTAPESPAATMDIKRFIEQFDHLTLRTMRSDDQRLRIELEPAALGKLVLQCKETSGGLSIELSVQGEAVRALLVGQEVDLRASLASQGVQVGQFSVSCQDRDGRPTDQQNADTPSTFGRLQEQTPQLAAPPAPARRLASWERNRWVA